MDIGPGDWVECVLSFASDPLNVGSLYCVSEVIPNPLGICLHCNEHVGFGINLIGVPQPRNVVVHGAWSPCAFRPIYRLDPLLIDALKAEPIDAEWVQMARIIGRTDGFIASQPHSPALRRILRGLS